MSAFEQMPPPPPPPTLKASIIPGIELHQVKPRVARASTGAWTGSPSPSPRYFSLPVQYLTRGRLLYCTVMYPHVQDLLNCALLYHTKRFTVLYSTVQDVLYSIILYKRYPTVKYSILQVHFARKKKKRNCTVLNCTWYTLMYKVYSTVLHCNLK